jgi:hypothetical protein
VRRDAGIDALLDTAYHHGTTMVTVMTLPDDAQLFDGTTDRGRGGTHIEAALGTRITLTCRKPGYRDGRVEVIFDGQSEAVMCRLTRIKRCIDGLKNPFDDCEPAAPVPAPAVASPPSPLN